MKFHRRFLFPLLLALTIFLATIGVSAKETAPATDQMPEEFFTLLESVPEDIAELLPEELFSSDRTQVGDAVVQMSDFGYLMQVLLSLIGANLTECLGLLASVCGLLILSSVCGTLRTSFRNEGVGQAFSFCSTLVILLSFFSQSYRCLESVTDYFAKLCGFSSASVPIMGVLYAMGGNVSTAVAASSGLSVFMAVLEQAVGKTVLPFCGICMALALISALNPALRTGTLLSTLKKNYTTALTFLMMLLLAMLAAQTTLAARSDTLAMKSVKFAEAEVIPGNGEVGVRLVHIRRQQPYAHFPALGDVLGHLGGVIQHRGEKGRHIFSGVVALHVGGAVGDDGVGYGVSLVEGVAGKVQYLVIDAVGDVLRHTPGNRAADAALFVTVDEGCALSVDNIVLLLAHSPADIVRLPQ